MNYPLIEQYRNIKKSLNSNEILFFQVGDFYEIFEEQAKIVSSSLYLKLTLRNGVLMCGFPLVNKILNANRLIKLGYKVVVCDQINSSDIKSNNLSNNLIERKIVEVLTRSINIYDNTIENIKYLSNYVAIIYWDILNTKNNSTISYYLSILLYDIKTGDCLVFSVKETNLFNILEEILIKYKVSEVVIPTNIINSDLNFLENSFAKKYKSFFSSKYKNVSVIEFDIGNSYLDNIDESIKKALNILSLECLGINSSYNNNRIKGSKVVVNILLKYLESLHISSISNITIKHIKYDDTMNLSKLTMDNLGWKSDSENTNTIFSILNQCMTSMGSRTLVKWFYSPLTKYKDILERHSIVSYFYNNSYILKKTRKHLKSIFDFEKIIGRIFLKKAYYKDFLKIYETLLLYKKIIDFLINDEEFFIFKELFFINDKLIYDYILIFEKYFGTLDSIRLNKSNTFIRKNLNDELDDLIFKIENSSQYIQEIENSERIKTGIKSIKVKSNNLGYFIEISKKNSLNIPSRYLLKQSLKNVNRYTTSQILEYENNYNSYNDQITKLESLLFSNFYLEVMEINLIGMLKKTASSISKIDILSSFAFISLKNKYVRPTLSLDSVFDIKNARHPILEISQQSNFIVNDIYFDKNDCQISVITGPNMAGKSTYLRQIAIISLISQIGCFVPSDYALLPILDNIFTRIGASDNIFDGKSTFFVEVSEVAYIINNMTSNSLVILDEIGRGTSMYDGICILSSLIEYFIKYKKKLGYILIATHYSEIYKVIDSNKVNNLKVTVKKEKDEINFLYKISSGVSYKSYGVNIAQFAGLKPEIIEESFKKMAILEKDTSNIMIQNDSFNIFQFKFDYIKKIIKQLDINNLDKLKAQIDKLKYYIDQY